MFCQQCGNKIDGSPGFCEKCGKAIIVKKVDTDKKILAVVLFAISFLLILAAFGKAGIVGEYEYIVFTKLCGVGYFLVVVFLALCGVALLRSRRKYFKTSEIIGFVGVFIFGLGLIQIMKADAGGIVGYWVALPLIRIIGVWASMVLLLVLICISAWYILRSEIDRRRLLK